MRGSGFTVHGSGKLGFIPGSAALVPRCAAPTACRSPHPRLAAAHSISVIPLPPDSLVPLSPCHPTTPPPRHPITFLLAVLRKEKGKGRVFYVSLLLLAAPLWLLIEFRR